MDRLRIAIAGNPNCGKTTLFNGLTGARQRVGNWPGVTVERKAGSYVDGPTTVEVVDLPGVYSLSVVPGMDSLDEKIARDHVLNEAPDVVVNIVDASNLERNLYLTAQLVEMRAPLVVALNMMDVAREDGIRIDIDELSRRFGAPVVPMVASRDEGLAELKGVIGAVASVSARPEATVGYSGKIEWGIAEIENGIGDVAEAAGADRRWLAVKLVEGDPGALGLAHGAAAEALARVVPEIEAELGEDIDILIADGRYGFANGIVRHVTQKDGVVRRKTSDVIDRVALNRWLGLPLFLGVMYLMFMFTINLGGAFIDFFDIAAGTLFVDGVGAALIAAGTPEWMKVLIADGVGGGIQVVATFIPIIGCLYLFLSVLEDSGYMARAAFLLDRFMRRIGLPGKAFLPLIVGFGCNVPAIMATRVLEKQRDRTMAVMMNPFMSCGARLAVYALFAAAFFPTGGQNVVFVLYLVGIGVAIGTGFILKHTLLRGDTTPFVMELPAYHVPRLKGVLLHAWARLKGFVFGAGKIIVAVVVVLSFLNSWGTDGSFGNEDSDRSVLSAIGRAIVPAFEPMGIGEDNWPATVGIFTGIFAKEAVVGTLDSLYGAIDADAAAEGETADDGSVDIFAGLAEAVASIPENLGALVGLAADPLGLGVVDAGSLEQAAAAQEVSVETFGAMVARFDGRVGAFAYMLFILLYFPCVAALGAIRREVGWRWAGFAGVWTTGIAYGAAVVVYQGATFTRDPATAGIWVGGIAVIFLATVLVLRVVGRRREGVGVMAAAE